jgi:hypothetical protein
MRMTRNFKAFGFTLVAVLLGSAVAASGVSANFEASSYPQHTVATDEAPNDKLVIGESSMQCSEESYTATLAGATPTLAFTPNWAGCKTEGAAFNNMTYTHNGCNLFFHETPADVSLNCPSGKAIELHHYNDQAHTNSTCTVTVGSQPLEGNPTYAKSNDELTIAGEFKFTLTTHGACSFNFTIHQTAAYTYSIIAVPTTQHPSTGESFTAASYPQHLVAHDEGPDDTFVSGSSTVTCSMDTATSTIEGKADQLAFTPSWVNCKTEGVEFNNVTVTHNECSLVLGVEPSAMEVDCPEGKVIEVHDYENQAHTELACTQTIADQIVGGEPNYTNLEKALTVSGKAVVKTQSHGACSFFFTVTQDATYTYNDIVETTSGVKIHRDT